mmetsp:Transcript_28515/g.25242  ORF Transcript_28515/g.25242 Transcript_28515/m.25242 type:complete len:93 (-) Transcript_28515:68-346(-)
MLIIYKQRVSIAQNVKNDELRRRLVDFNYQNPNYPQQQQMMGQQQQMMGQPEIMNQPQEIQPQYNQVPSQQYPQSQGYPNGRVNNSNNGNFN